MADEPPTQRTEKGLRIPVPTRKDWDDLAKIVKPVHDGPQEIEGAARQEGADPEDDTTEG